MVTFPQLVPPLELIPSCACLASTTVAGCTLPGRRRPRWRNCGSTGKGMQQLNETPIWIILRYRGNPISFSPYIYIEHPCESFYIIVETLVLMQKSFNMLVGQ